MLIALVALACHSPDDSGSEGDADTDSDTDTDTDADTDTDTDTDWGAYTGPPRAVITVSDAKKSGSRWALYDLETLLWRISGEAVDAHEVVPTCSAAWVGLIRRNGEDDDGVDLKDAESGFTLDDIVLPVGALPRSASGIESGGVAVGFDNGHTIELYSPGDPAGSIDLSKYGDAKDTVHVAALTWWEDTLLAVVDAGADTDAVLLGIDPSSGSVVLERPLHTAAISDEVAVVDGQLWMFGRGDSLHPAAIEATDLSTGLFTLIDAGTFGQTFTAASFAAEGFWVAVLDDDDEANVRWVGFDGTEGPVLIPGQPIGDVAAEGSTGFWLTEGTDGHKVTRYDAGGKALGSWTFSAPASIRSCGADAL